MDVAVSNSQQRISSGSLGDVGMSGTSKSHDRTPKKTYSLFGVGDGMNSLWQACNSVISTVAEPSTLNPTQDPRIEAFSPKAHDLSQLKGLREFTHSSSASSFGETSGNFLSAPEDDYSCYNPAYLQQYSNLQYDSCWDDQHSLLLQPAYLPAFNQQLALCSTALDMSACHQLPAPAVTPEHVHMAHLPRAELLMSPLAMTPNRFLGASLLSPQPPCARSWADTARAGGMSAPASPAGHTLFIGQPPPPPPRVSSVPPPPPPRPSPHYQTPLAPIQYDLTARVAALMSTSSSPPTPVHPGGCTSSSYGRLLQGAFGREDPFLQAMPAPVRIGTSAVLGTDQHGSASAPSTSAGRDDLAAADVAHALPKLATDGSIGPITPTALLTAAGRRPLSGSRLSRSSSGTGSFHSCDSREASMGGAAPGPSRLSSSGAGQLSRMGSRASTSGPCASARVPGAGAPPIVPAPPAKPVRIPPAQLMYMEMHDPDCSAYCLGGNLEPHKMWFGVGVHRAIRKLVTNNKRRHSLILALHAAGSGNGYGDLGNVYDAVKGMHDGLAAGTGWNTEAGAKLFAGVEELKELLEHALRDGPGNDGYNPPASLRA